MSARVSHCMCGALLFVIVIHLPIAKPQTPPWDINSYSWDQNGNSRSRLFQVFEQALLSSSQNLFNLQEIFFNPDGTSPSRVNITVTTTVGDIKFDPVCTCMPEPELSFFYNNCTDATAEPWEFGYPQACSYNSPCHDCWIRIVHTKFNVNSDVGNSTSDSSDILIWADPNRKLGPGTINDLFWNDDIHTALLSTSFVAVSLFMTIPTIANYQLPPIRRYNDGDTDTTPKVKLSLNISELDFMPCEKDVINTIKELLVWAKTYAHAAYGGKTIEKSESDRGVIWSKGDDAYYGYWNGNNIDGSRYSANAICNIIVSLVFILNFLTLLFAYFSLDKITQYFLSNSNDHMVSHVYWSLSFFVGVCNLALLGWNCYSYIMMIQYYYLYFPIDSYSDPTRINFNIILSTKAICYLMMILLEPVIAWKASKSVRVPVNNVVLAVNVFIYTLPCHAIVCCVPCICFVMYALKRCSCAKRYSRVVHTVVLCNILWFIHELESAVVVTVFFVINDPPVMLTILTLVILLFVCVILMISTVLRIVSSRQSSRIKMFVNVLFAVFFWIVIMTLLIVITMLYLAFLDYGLNYSTVGGFILSAIPPIIIFVLTLYFKKRFTNRDSTSAVNDTTNDPERHLGLDSFQMIPDSRDVPARTTDETTSLLYT